MQMTKWNESCFSIVSWANGLAYSVADTRTGREFFLQGDEAAVWREAYDAATDTQAFLARCMTDYGRDPEPPVNYDDEGRAYL